MERLTFDGNFCDIARCRELPCKYDGNCAQKEVCERLKAYEDSGWKRNRRKRCLDPDWPTQEERKRYFEGVDGV